MSLSVVLASFALCLFFSEGKAQSDQSIAACNAFTVFNNNLSWMNNSEGQDPCTVVGYLLNPCFGGSWTLPALETPGDFYSGVLGENYCMCNTVFYSLMEACQLCQFYVPEAVQTWTKYASNCTDPFRTNGSYPIDQDGIGIPAWGYQDVSFTDKFNVTEAQQIAAQDLPDTTVALTSSSASSTATATTTSSHSSNASTTSTAGSDTKDVAAIVGGVLGSLLGILFLGIIAIYLLLRKRNSRRQAQVEASERPMPTATAEVSLMSMISTPSKVYDANDLRIPSNQAPPCPSTGMRAMSPTPSSPPASMSGYMPHSFGTTQSYSNSNLYGGVHGQSYVASTSGYKGVPEI